MKSHTTILCVAGCLLALGLGGCDANDPSDQEAKRQTKGTSNNKIQPVRPVEKVEPKGKRVKLAANVFLEVLPEGKRRVLVESYVCRRDGQLEQLLCRKDTKEHESILAADVDARFIHAALTAAGAEAGSPVQFVPQYKGAHGTKIMVFVQYKDKKGKLITERAQNWLRNFKTRKEMAYDWVFAGSKFIRDPDNPNQPPLYTANEGDVICIANFDTAMLDVPVNLPNENAQLNFEAWTDRIPPMNTPVTVILEPVLTKKK